MFTALILACNTGFTNCRTFMFPDLLADKDACFNALASGIEQMDSVGLLVKDYKCVLWDSDT